MRLVLWPLRAGLGWKGKRQGIALGTVGSTRGAPPWGCSVEVGSYCSQAEERI